MSERVSLVADSLNPCPTCRRVLTARGSLCDYCKETAALRSELARAREAMADALEQLQKPKHPAARAESAIATLTAALQPPAETPSTSGD